MINIETTAKKTGKATAKNTEGVSSASLQVRNSWPQYRPKARDIYKNPEHIRCRMYEGQLQFTFYSQAQGGYVVADTNGVIRGCFADPKLGAIDKYLATTENQSYNIKGVTK